MSTYTTNRGFWAEQLLLELGAPVNSHTLDGILAWMAAENTKARNNPLATTRVSHHGTPFNSAGVQNYPTFAGGMDATVETISRTAYKHLREVIRSGKSAHAIATAVLASPWGTQTIPIADCIAHPAQYASILLHT